MPKYNVEELIERLNQIKDKKKDVWISLKSPYGSDYDLSTDDIEIAEDEYSIEFTTK